MKNSTSTQENVFSNWERVQHGVSQGSVRGLLILLLYTNDLPLNVNPVSVPV
jgi:hypothetical protein